MISAMNGERWGNCFRSGDQRGLRREVSFQPRLKEEKAPGM